MQEPTLQNRMRSMKRIACTFITALVVGCALIYFGSRSDAVTLAQSIKSGVLTADQVNIAFDSVSGRLMERRVEESQTVSPGEALLVLDDTDTKIALAKNRALLDAQKAALAQEIAAIAIAKKETDVDEQTSWRTIEETQAKLTSDRASLALAQSEYQRAQKLVAVGGVSHSVFDSAASTLTAARAAVRQSERSLAAATIGATEQQLKVLAKNGSAQGMTLSAITNARATIANRDNNVKNLSAQVRQIQADIEQLEVNQKRLTLTAPAHGKILEVLYHPGDMVNANATAVLLETDRRYFDIYVNETQAAAYAPGKTVSVHVPALDRDITGTVRFTSAAASFADLRSVRERGQADLTNFQVRIYIDADPAVLTGMTMEVRS